VADRRRKAEKAMQKLMKKGHAALPVAIDGRAIAKTFWGKAWCDNLEGYSDFENRLPRGRTYVRNGSVLDLQIAPGEVSALVSGSQIYRVSVKVSSVPKAHWDSICTDCAGAIDSLVELLQGRFSKGVMERICRQKTGLFPAPDEIRIACSCPDYASMCKHVAAVLYGIGARLDEQPELLFTLRRVDGKDLLANADQGLPLSLKGPADEKLLDADGLAELFGLELGMDADGPSPDPGPPPQAPGKKRRPTKAAPTREKKSAPVNPARRPPSAMVRRKAPKPKAKPQPQSATKKRKRVKR
jgi:uncharacterized Zn finger protein